MPGSEKGRKEWIYVRIEEWENGLEDEKIEGWKDGLMDERIERWKDGLMDERMRDGRMG